MNRLILTNYDYVDINDQVHFLGEWIEKCDTSLVAYHFSNQDFLQNANKYLSDLYLNYLEDISKFLNEIHGTDNSERYWEILLGTWLMNYLVVYYDRFITINNLKDNYFSSFSITFKKEELPMIYDYYQFSTLSASNEQFNYNIFVDMMDFLNVKYSICRNMLQNNEYKRNIMVRDMKNKILTFVNKLSLNSPFTKTYISSTGLSVNNLLKLIIKSKFRIIPLFFYKIQQREIKQRDEIRKNLKSFLKSPKNEFERYINNRLIKDIPISYIENYKTNIKKMKEEYINEDISSSIMFSKFQDSSELFKFFLADFIKNSNNYYGYQHGGYYGMLKFKQQEFNEIRISDKYFSWGQRNTFFTTEIEVHSTSPLKFANLNRLQSNKKYISKIAYIGVNFNYYLYELESYYLGPQWKEYYSLQEQFFSNLSLHLRDRIKNRIYGFHAQEKKIKLSNKISWIKFDDEKKMENHFNNETLLIIDYPGTTFLEALYVNIPTILFWDKNKFLMRDGVENDLETLRSCNILFDTPLEAVNYLNNHDLNEIKDNWYKGSSQLIIEKFLTKYANFSNNWINELIEKLDEY